MCILYFGTVSGAAACFASDATFSGGVARVCDDAIKQIKAEGGGGGGGCQAACQLRLVMLLAVWCLGLYVLLVHGLNLYASVLGILIYMLWYLDGREYTGERHWPQFRRFLGWKYLSPMTYYIGNTVDLEQLGSKQQRLYILVPGITYYSVFWGIGLHGGRLPPKMSERLHWVVPPLVMAIPLLRDVLLWAGAVTYHEKHHPLTDVMLALLNANRSVCYTVGDGQTMPTLSDEILNFAREHQTQLVPMVVSGERKRYHIVETPMLQRVQRWTFRHAGYPFPMLVALRCCGRTRPPPLVMQVGSILHCSAYQDTAQLKESFNTHVHNLRCEELGDEPVNLV